MTTLRNLRYTNPAQTNVDLEVAPDDVNFFPFHYVPGDTAPMSLEIATLLGDYTIADYVPPPEPVPPVITRRQFFVQLARNGIITRAEALTAFSGTLPATLQAFVDNLSDPDAKLDAAAYLLAGPLFRSSPIIAALAAANGWTDTQIDNLWRSAAAL